MYPENHWNYRVVLYNGALSIHSVHYANGVPHSMSESPQTVSSGKEEGLESVRWQLDMMAKALEKPVLEYVDGQGFKEIPDPPKLCFVCEKRPVSPVSSDGRCDDEECIPF